HTRSEVMNTHQYQRTSGWLWRTPTRTLMHAPASISGYTACPSRPAPYTAASVSVQTRNVHDTPASSGCTAFRPTRRSAAASGLVARARRTGPIVRVSALLGLDQPKSATCHVIVVEP